MEAVQQVILERQVTALKVVVVFTSGPKDGSKAIGTATFRVVIVKGLADFVDFCGVKP